MEDDPLDNLLYINCKTLEDLNTFVQENNFDINDTSIISYRNELLKNDQWIIDKLQSFKDPSDILQFERLNPLFRGLSCIQQRKRELKILQVRKKYYVSI